MAHYVKFTIPRRELGKSDVEFEIYRNGPLFGTLKVSKGSIVWFPRGKGKGLKMGWKKFDGLMKEEANRTERR